MIRAITFLEILPLVFNVKIHDYTKAEQEFPDPVTFFSYEDARLFLSKQRRKWLIEHYTNFVKHKSKLFRVSGGDYYRNTARLDNLTRLENSVDLIPSMQTGQLCNVIVKASSMLLSILPHRSNPSFDNSTSSIHQILNVAKDELNDEHGLFKSKINSPKYY